VFGLQQTHRNRLLRDVEQFKAEGVQIEIGKSWRDFVWLRVPKNATLIIEPVPIGKWEIGSTLYGDDDCERRVTALTHKLRDFGVSEITADTGMGNLFTVFLNDEGNAFFDFPRSRLHQRPVQATP
jgi:hypothetical protein